MTKNSPRRLPRSASALVLVLATATVLSTRSTAAPQTQLRAGVASVDQSWHLGAPSGQYADNVNPADPIRQEWDPNLQHVTKQSAYGLQSRLAVKALVIEGPDHTRVALVKQDAYLSQDYLSRRVAQLLAAHGSGVTYEHLMISATHDHSAPYYTTPSAGVWVFEDVFDLRQFEYQARAIASAIEQAEARLRPVRIAATEVTFPDFQGNITGPSTADDGSPAGYPREENDHGLVVMRVDDMTHPSHPKPFATWMNYAQHGEELDGYNLTSADFLGPLQKVVEADTGSTLVFTQGSVGSAEGPYEGWYKPGKTPVLSDGTHKAFGHTGFAQLQRGSRLLADAVVGAWRQIGAGHAKVPWTTSAPVAMMTRWTPGPLSHPYPGVSNCRTETTLRGDVGLPVLGLPDCQRSGLPQATSPLYDSLAASGLPFPANYDATSFASVEENLRLKLQVVRIGEILLASCSCEPQSDLIKNIETRTDTTQHNEWLGYDWGALCHKAGSSWNCPDPRDDAKRLTVTDHAYQRMIAEVRNDAAGWDDSSYVAQAGSEPQDPKLIKGNFTHRENPAKLGYTLTVGLGHTGDYDGYTVSYREYQSRDSYRKALTSYGPHTGDYMATKLAAMAAFLKGGPALATEPTAAINAVDEQRQTAESAALGVLSSYYYDGWALQLPADLGPVRALAQPATTKRFSAATFRWVGGSDYADQPLVTVQRQVGGRWVPYADQTDGAVVTTLKTPDGVTSLVDSRAGNLEWDWSATFEAYDAWPRHDLSGGQTPAGTYRFVVDGNQSTGGALKRYLLESKPFQVTAWNGLSVSSITRIAGGAVKVLPAAVVYPKTYSTPSVPTIHNDGEPYLCRTCSFMPWAQKGTVAKVVVSVMRGGKVVRVVPASPTAGGWVAQTRLSTGETARVNSGGILDSYGETNLKPSKAV